MNGDLAVTAIPYVLAIIIKVCSITLDEHSIIGALEDLAVLPRPKNIDFKLNSDQRAVIFNHVSHALLKSDFGILKWSTSAVCFGPPWAQQTSTLDLSVSLSLEAGVGLESQGGVIRADSSGI